MLVDDCWFPVVGCGLKGFSTNNPQSAIVNQ